MDKEKAEQLFDVVQKILDTTIAVVPLPPVQIALATVSSFLTFVRYISGLQKEPGKAVADELSAIEGQLFELKLTVEWESSRVFYNEEFKVLRYVRRKLVAMQYMTDDDKKREHLRKLKDVRLEMHLESLLEALGIEENDLLDSDILRNYYKYSNGHRNQLALLSVELMSLIVSGIFALYLIRNLTEKESTRVVSTNSRDSDGKSDGDADGDVKGTVMAGVEKDYYSRKLKITNDNIQRVLEKCKDDCKINMEKDIEKYFKDVNGKKSNTAMVKEIATLLEGKYDWLEVACIVFTGKIKDCIMRSSHEQDISVNIGDNCCVVFVRENPGLNNVEADENQSISPEPDVDNIIPTFVKSNVMKRKEQESRSEDPNNWRAASIRNRTITIKSDIQFARGSSGQVYFAENKLRKIDILWRSKNHSSEQAQMTGHHNITEL